MVTEKNPSDDTPEHPYYDAVCDGGDLDCGSGLLLIIRRAMDPLRPGQVLEVRSRESSVAVDLPAWCTMVGHVFQRQWPAPNGYTYYHVRKGADAVTPTTPAQDREATENYTWQVRLEYRPNAPARVYSRNVQWEIGQPASFSERVDAPNAIDQFLSAIAGEILMGFSQIASEQHVVIDDMELMGKIQLQNILVHLGVQKDGTPRISLIEGVLYISSPATRDQLEIIWQNTLHRSPIVQTIMPMVPMKLRWMII